MLPCENFILFNHEQPAHIYLKYRFSIDWREVHCLPKIYVIRPICVHDTSIQSRQLLYSDFQSLELQEQLMLQWSSKYTVIGRFTLLGRSWWNFAYIYYQVLNRKPWTRLGRDSCHPVVSGTFRGSFEPGVLPKSAAPFSQKTFFSRGFDNASLSRYGFLFILQPSRLLRKK